MHRTYDWGKYLITEKDFIEAKKYVDIVESNFNVSSLFFSNQVILLGSEIEAAFKKICSLNGINGGNISQYKEETLKSFPKIGDYFSYISYTDYQVFPFDDWKVEGKKLDWWEVYKNVKHSIVDEKATLKIALTMLCALQLLLVLIEAKSSSIVDANGFKSMVLFQNELPNLLIPGFKRTLKIDSYGVKAIYLVRSEEIK